MKITGREREYRNIYMFLVLLFALSLVSCAASKTYWLNLRADSIVQKSPTTKLTIGVVPFQDNRPPSGENRAARPQQWQRGADSAEIFIPHSRYHFHLPPALEGAEHTHC